MKFGEYHPGDIFEYSPVLAGENSVTRCVKTNRVRAKIFDGLIYMIMLLFSKQKKMMIMMMMMILIIWIIIIIIIRKRRRRGRLRRIEREKKLFIT